MRVFSGLYRSLSLIVPVAVTSTLLVPATAAHASESVYVPPTVVVTTPADGSTVQDQVLVGATGSVDPLGDDSPFQLTLVIDGELVGSGALCPTAGDPTSCALQLPWDSTGLSGQHTVQVLFDTDEDEAISAPVTVTVANPPPTAVITSPLPGAIVSGTTTVTATGNIDPKQTDSAKDLQLVVDGAATGPVLPCPAGSTTCASTFSWDTTGLSGSYDLAVRFDTADASVLSPVVPVVVEPAQNQPQPTQIALSTGGIHRRGSRGVVWGLVTNPQDHRTVIGVPVTVTFTPPTGPAWTVTVTTDGNGVFVAVDPYRLEGNTTVQASTGPAYGSSSATGTLLVTVRIFCRVPSTVQRGRQVTVDCRVRGLAPGSVVELHAAGPATDLTAYSSIDQDRVAFTVVFAARGHVLVWATTAASSTYVAAQSRLHDLRVL